METSKVNGLSSATRFYDYFESNGDRVEYHEHPKTGELVIMRTWFVSDGTGCVAGEFEVIGVYSWIGCQIAKLNAPYLVNGVHKLSLSK